MEKALERLAEQILSFDEASLTSLKERYRKRIDHFDGSRDWEKSVIIYAIIHSVIMKNALFNENVLRNKKERHRAQATKPRHTRLKRVK